MLSRPTALFAALAVALSLCLLLGCEDPATPPEPAPLPLVSPEDVIQALVRAYNSKDTVLLATLLASEPGVECRFLPCGVSDPKEGSVLDPKLPPPLLPPDLTPQAILVNVLPLESFGPRPDLYSADGGLDGKLDPGRWRAMDASYSTDLLIQLMWDTDYRLEGETNFVLIQDLTKQAGDPRDFLLYLWEERCLGPTEKEDS